MVLKELLKKFLKKLLKAFTKKSSKAFSKNISNSQNYCLRRRSFSRNFNWKAQWNLSNEFSEKMRAEFSIHQLFWTISLITALSFFWKFHWKFMNSQSEHLIKFSIEIMKQLPISKWIEIQEEKWFDQNKKKTKHRRNSFEGVFEHFFFLITAWEIFFSRCEETLKNKCQENSKRNWESIVKQMNSWKYSKKLYSRFNRRKNSKAEREILKRITEKDGHPSRKE